MLKIAHATQHFYLVVHLCNNNNKPTRLYITPKQDVLLQAILQYFQCNVAILMCKLLKGVCNHMTICLSNVLYPIFQRSTKFVSQSCNIHIYLTLSLLCAATELKCDCKHSYDCKFLLAICSSVLQHCISILPPREDLD